MEIVAISGQPRTETGKKAAKNYRSQELVPAVLYGGKEVFHFTANQKDLRLLVYTPDFKVASININGQAYRAIVKDVQYDPVSDQIIHIDFLRLIDGVPVKIELPVRFEGSSPGVKSGGKLIQQLRRIKVKTVPEKLIDELRLDISTLELGQTIRVRDIAPTDGVEIINQPGTPVAMIEIPRALRSAAAAAEKSGK